MNKTLIIMRGIPGCGKSTLARAIKSTSKSCRVVNADDLLMNGDGVYEWTPQKMFEAHAMCHAAMETYMQSGVELIINDGTNSKKSDYEKYLVMAEQYGYTVHIMVIENHHGNDSIHNVPEKTINKMKARFGIKL